MNKIGINYCGQFGETPAEACRLFSDLGFDAVFTGSTEGDVEDFAKEAQKVSIFYECVHAPFKGINNIWLDNEENQRKLANIAYIFEVYDDVEQVRFCWDTGHEKCFACGREYMPLFGHKLVYTHIHDNFSQPGGDLHMIPFDGNIDYSKVVKHLKNADYAGTLTLEVIPNVWEGYNGISRGKYYQKAYDAIVKIRNMM